MSENRESPTKKKLRKPYALFGALAALALALIALLLVPMMGRAPESEVDVRLPSMQRVPTEEGQLSLEVEPEPSPEQASPEQPR